MGSENSYNKQDVPPTPSCCMATLSFLPYHHALKKSFISIEKPQGGVAQDEFL
jgi:hypothetical protein